MQLNLTHLGPVMRKYDAELTVRPHDFLNEAFGWYAKLELRDRPTMRVDGDGPLQALENLDRLIREAGL